MLLLLEAMNLYIYAESHWKYHTVEGYYNCSFSKLRHKAHQKVCKCSPTFPLRNGIEMAMKIARITCYSR